MRLLATFSLLGLTLAAAATAQENRVEAFEIVEELDRLAAASLWPGFDPRSTPLVIYDGETTWLFRHPNPPAPFERHATRDDTWMMKGRAQLVRANTSEEIGGVETAIMAYDPAAARSAERLAALLIHETFHAFQVENHPDWFADESELFVYPVEDARVLSLRREETDALRRSVMVDAEDAGCWMARAVELRSERFALMTEGAASYEREVELSEGLATYIETVAEQSSPTMQFSKDGFGATNIRNRGYASGAALAFGLDRLRADWKQELNAETRPLDELLAEAIAASSIGACALGEEERLRISERAEADVATVVSGWEHARSEFVSQSGWTIEVVAEGEPLWPQGFDPLNVQRVRPNEILHTRWVKLGNSQGQLEVLDWTALTEAAGEHPLYNGVRRLIVKGLSVEPTVSESEGAGAIAVTAGQFEAEFRNARVEREGKRIVVRLGDG